MPQHTMRVAFSIIRKHLKEGKCIMHNYLQAFRSVSNWTTNTPFPNVCSFEAH